MRSAALVLSFLALAACGGPKSEAPPAAPAAAIDVREVAAADGYGEAGETVTAVAFWSHPSVNFQGLILASTATGLKAFNIETGAVAASSEGNAADALAVAYSGTGPQAQGYAVMQAAGAYAFYAIGNDTPSLTPLTATNTAAGAPAFCVSGARLYEAGNDKLSARDLSLSPESVSIGDARVVAEVDGVIACHVDDRSGDVITISRDGAIKRVTPSSGEAFGLTLVNDLKPGASALFLMTTAEPENEPGGAVAVLDGPNGVIRLFDLIDGHALGAVRIKATFDLDAVVSAKTIAAGYANYGGVYRDGALAVVTQGDGAPIRLAPWNGVLAALNLPIEENVNPRDPHPAGKVEDVLSIDIKQP
jgi:hypothetical protein